MSSMLLLVLLPLLIQATYGQGKYLLQIICDDITTVFVDGEQKTVAGTEAWNQMAALEISASTSTIGIQCRNTGGPYGIMAQVTDETGKVLVVSDNSWKCSNQAQDGWSAGGFSEGASWKPATVTNNQTPYLSNTGAWAGMSPDKKVIWTNSAADTTVYCRKDLPKTTDLGMDVICDDISTIFVDGKQRNVVGTGAWNQMASLLIPSDTGVVGIQCRNTGGPYGIMAQIQDSSEKIIAVTDDSWSCSNTAEDGWSTADFSEGDNWQPAAYYSGQGPYKQDIGAWQGMSSNKRIIWTASGDATVYCRKVLPKASAPKVAMSGAWKVIPGGLTKISKGKSGIWGVNRNDQIWNLNSDGNSWTRINGGLVQVSSGASVWGVNVADMIYKYLGSNSWQNIDGRLTNVDVSDSDNVWGVNRAGNIYRWLGSGWEQIAGKAIQVSVGNSGVWVVNAANDIFYRVGTYGDVDIAGTSWVHIPGKLKWIASGNNVVVGVNSNDDIYYRVGISADNPTGTNWVKVNGKLMNIDLLDDEVVGTNSANKIFRCPMVAPPTPVEYTPCEEGDSCIREKGTGSLLPAGNQLVSKNGRAKLVMQDDGNLVLYCTVKGKALWASDSSTKSVNSGLKIQEDGNMVLYAGDTSVWASDTDGNADSVELVVQDDHNVVLYNYEDRTALWATDTAGEYCPDAKFVENCAADKCVRESQVASILSLGEKLASKNGKAVLTMQTDGNLVLTCSVNDDVLWKTDTSGVALGLRFQSDGNLVLYDADRKALWASGSSGNFDKAELVVQDDMNVVLYNSADRTALWASDTSGAECADPPSTVDGHTFNAEKNVEYELKKQLEVGDVIRAWGVYKDHTTSKFSVNIRGSSSLYHIHVDFRPYNDVVVLNNYNNGWKTEVRPAFSRSNFAANTIFEVRIEVHENEYRIFFNGKQLAKTFPHREDLGTANHVVLHGGSNGFKWTALQLPTGLLAGSGIPFATSTGEKNYLELPLAVGDVITAWGIYATDSSKFNVNLMMENDQYFMIHVDFRPPPSENKVVLNSKKQNGWETELRTALPTFENGKVFKVDVKCLDGEFEISHDGNILGSRFPYRDGFALEDVKFIWLLGGSLGMVWTDLALPHYDLEGALITAEHNVPSEFDTGCDLKVVVNGRAGDWNGDVTFLAGDQEMLLIGLHPERRNLAVRNDVFKRGILQWTYQWVDATYPDADDEGKREYTLAFTPTGFALKCGDTILLTIPYEELTDDKEQFLSSINLVRFKLSTEAGPIFLQYARKCQAVGGASLDLVSASQSSTGSNGDPMRGIDGNTNGNYWAHSCTHSEGSKNNWWMATLAENSAVSKVVIHNRVDCCSERINGAKVYVGDVYCGQVVYEAGKVIYEVECGNAVGGSVKVVQNDQPLTLCEVQALGAPSDETPLVNIASGFPTWQSSEGWSGAPSRGTDGRSNGNYWDGSCTHSGSTDYNMWKVDLIDKYEINRVVIHNRIDCCAERIDGVQVFVNNKPCGAVEYVAGQDVYVVDCADQVGNVIKITQEDNHLTLCEVEILARVSAREGSLINVASSGDATQDSTGWEGVASRATDGSVSGQYFEGKSCSHNGDLVDGWWNLEFPEPTPVNKVVIYNREDCCQDRIDNVKIYADGELCGSIDYVEGQRVYTKSCGSDTTEYRIATNIRITAAEGTYLTLCEVQVLSDPNALSADNLVNLAYNKPTSQSSTGWGGVSSRAVDGKEAGKYSSGTCTHTSGPGWWSVDLGDNFVVEKIWIRNRIDCCSERLDGVQVYVGDILCGTVEYNSLKYNYVLICGEGIVGDSVKIVNGQASLTLCEVKVYGDDTPVIESTDKEVVGDKSSTADDAQSLASCPVGYVVTYCEAQSGLVHTKCDGAFVKPDNGGVCVAVNGGGGPGAVAKAVCSQFEQVTDPCNGPNIPKFKNLHSRGPNPSLQCPPGYEQILCNARSPWLGKLTGKGVDGKGVIANDKDCAVSGCTDRNWCEVTAVCQLIEDRVAYAAAVCSTCEGYHCGEGQECVMMDMDDDPSDKETPTCVEKQTGCDDNDRCGDKGVCAPVGSDGYECECGEGFEFSIVTGSCIPVHTIWRTVYGEPAVGDDAISYAECNAGEVVMRCHTFGAPSAADGVYITSGDDGIVKCIARASNRGKYPIIAVAYCGTRATVTDPCTQETIHSVEYRFASAHSPSVSCPGGYYMESCIFHSPWTQNMKDAARAQVNSIGSVDVDDDGSCSIDSCLKTETDTNFCKLTAVCAKLTGDEYVRDACPTCEQVQCPGDQVCDLVNDLPFCLPRIPGGCETDNCGAGTCVEDGPNYTCECDSGYKFNGETCEDVDECQELPCGNGECSNEPGSYSCACKDGFYEVQGTCKDVDECLDDPCSDTERCSNEPGSYICDCLDTFIRDPESQACVCADGFEVVDEKCADIDDCAGESPCGENEACFNTAGNYFCECDEGFERGKDGVCKDFTPTECDVKPKNDDIKTMSGKKVQVRLVGEVKKTWKKYADITWLKNNEPWDPKSDGKEKFNGFTIRNFQAEDAAIYVGNIYIEMSREENYKCSVTVHISLKEGSATIDIEDRENLASTQKVGKGMAIVCDVKLTNVDLENAGDPNNVNWYRVNQETGEDSIIEATDSIKINKTKGTYRLWFVSPQPEDSGTYKCEFSQQGVEASTDVSVVWA